jgi:hypothetical protein
VRGALGTFLLVAAGLKIHGLALGPFAQDAFLGSPRLLIAAIEVEVVLGLWLLSGWSVRAAWTVALGFFTILAGASLYLALTGQRSCGCLGQVTVSPWLMFGLDAGAVAALALWRPAHSAARSPAVWCRQALKIVAGAAVLLALGSSGFLLAFPGPAEALAWLRGEAITVEPVVSDVGKGQPGEQQTFRVNLTNRTDRPVRLVGGTTSCRCTATNDLPLILAPGETGTIEVEIMFVGSPGRFRHHFVLFTDDERQPRVVARFSGQVIAPP